MITILQGRPETSYFAIVELPGLNIKTGDQVKCINPHNNKVTKAVCVDTFTEQWGDIPDSFGLLTYGFKPPDIRASLSVKHSIFKTNEYVRFLLLRELKN